VLIDEESIRVRAPLEQLAREPGVGEARVRDVQERRPAARAARLVRVAREAAAEN
jgi:hypothetical protein